MVIGVATTISESTAAIAGETASDLIPIACVEILERLNEQGSKFISIANANTQSGAKE
jgi:hypothetical protein